MSELNKNLVEQLKLNNQLLFVLYNDPLIQKDHKEYIYKRINDNKKVIAIATESEEDHA